MTNDLSIGQRFARYREKNNLSQADLAQLLGLSRNYVSMIEQGREPKESVAKLFETIEGADPQVISSPRSQVFEAPPQYQRSRSPSPKRVPIVGWAQAGEGHLFEDIPDAWHEFISSDVPDEKAIGITIEGDSMEPRFRAGDIAIVMPSVEPRNGCHIVAKHKRDGVFFKLFHVINGGPKFRFTSYNPLYPPFERNADEFHWLYPVYTVTQKVWR